MTLQEAIEKAKSPMQPKDASSDNPYEIKFDQAESVKSLVGKTIRSKTANNNNQIKIVKWVGQNYVTLTNESDYGIVPAVWVLANLNKMIVE